MARACFKKVAFAVLVLLSVPAGAADVQTSANIRLRSAAEERTGELQTAEATLDLEAGAAIGANWSWSGKLRLRADSEDRLEPGRPSQRERSDFNRRWLLGDTADLELRELYADGHLGSAFLRIGKQQVVWGQADGLRVLDAVNPFSFREFVWPDAQDRRIPLWMLRAEAPLGPATLQVLYIPDPTYDEIPLGNAAFAVTTPLLVPRGSTPIPVREAVRPSGLKNSSDFGARVSALVGGWDLTLNYLYHYYDDPVPFIELSAMGAVSAPSYERSQLFGGSFSNAFGSTTVRGELGYSTDRWFITRASADADRVFSSDELALVIGIDNVALADTLISAQYFHSQLRDPAPGMTRNKHERQATLLIQRSFRNESLKLRMLALRSLDRDDGGLQARLSWQVSDAFALSLSLERFYGDRDGLFGEFRDASRVGIEAQWSWTRDR